ncbi:putative DsbA family dithiol-disulfide isomerase [Nocardioides thalensis]|uniref:Putative DsbA family dithiol-disulfide isomerase n=1 Tax=Nocardioides thalensis TaxID=1914755 RepID=A0A853C070_9ACTN|nr:DsbA family oxidoreductase [Nocardioides thalensis]NYJ00664.1 putative DsbA family dithiol-disulfide isomerase [Nocardioides thalensis]
MRIDVWSDVVCPWCSIGKKRLEKAIAGFPHRDQVEVVYHSFQLDPSAPTEPTETARQMLSRKYRMSDAQAAEAQGRVIALAAEEGMDFTRHSESPFVGTADAHRLLHLALAESGPERQAVLKDALLHAYFGEASNVADHAVLREVAVAAGLDPVRVDEVLSGREYADAVEADIRQAAAYGATGVPFFVVDQKFGISGAQPVELFAQALERAWAAAHPVLETVPGAADADACGPDGCPI